MSEQEHANLVGPGVNLNGTRPAELLRQYLDALGALRTTQVALAEMRPHGRDYQTLPPAAFDTARAQHQAREERLDAIRAEITALALSLLP